MIQHIDAIALVIQTALALALFICGFLRLALTDGETIVEIRAALVWQSATAATLIFAPWAPLADPVHLTWQVGTTPEIFWLMLLSSAAGIQVATMHHWEHGTPRGYIKPECRPMRRQNDFRDSASCS